MKRILITIGFVCMLFVLATAQPTVVGPMTKFNDALFQLHDNADVSKKLSMQLSGITTGTTRTWTIPDRDLDLGSPVFDEIKLSDEDYIGWWNLGARQSYIKTQDSGLDLYLYAADKMDLTAVGAMNITGASGTIDVGTGTVKTASLEASDQSCAVVYRTTSTQTINDLTWAKIQLNDESIDNDDEFDSATNYRFTATAAGTYVISYGIGFRPGIADGERMLGAIRLDGNATHINLAGAHASHNNYIGVSASFVRNLTASQYIELWAYHTHADSLDVDYTNGMTYLCIWRLG